jgi:hypothetical protein
MRSLRILTLAAVSLLLAGSAAAQFATDAPPPKETKPDAWVHKVKLSLGLSQSYYTQNWSGDEVGTISWLAGVDALGARQWSSKFKLENTLVLAFGQTHQQDKTRSVWESPVKSADKIDFDSFGRFTLGKWLDPYLALTLDSQFFESRPGYGTRNLNPLQIGELAGVAHAFYDSKPRTLVSRAGFGVRQHIQRFYGEDPSVLHETTNDGGFEFRTIGRFATADERTDFKTDLYLFQAVFFSESDLDAANRWKQLDVRWQNTLNTKVYKVFTVSLYAEYFYDAQVRRAGQFKQTVGLGVSYDL